MTQYLTLVDSNPELLKKVRTRVAEYEQMSEGDKLVVAGQIVEKMNKQEHAMIIMSDMLKNKQLELKAYQAKLGRKLSDKELSDWVNNGSLPQLLDDVDKELLAEARKISGQCKQLTKK